MLTWCFEGPMQLCASHNGHGHDTGCIAAKVGKRLDLIGRHKDIRCPALTCSISVYHLGRGVLMAVTVGANINTYVRSV